MSDDPKPTIRIASCRGDGRCPECCRDWTERGVLSLLPLPPCGCHCCPDCERGHLRRLLTEALRQRDEHYFKGIKDVRMIRCMAHHKVPAFNSMEANGGECAVCVVDDIGKARDAALRDVEMWKAKAIRVSGEADALEKERDAVLQKAEFWKTSDEAWVDVAGRAMAILGHPNSSDLIGVAEKIVERMAEVEAQRDDAIRERDEARATKDMHKERQEDLEITVQIERERAERAEALLAEARAEHRDISQRYIAASSARIRAEALLRECETVLDELYDNRTSGPALLAKIRETAKVEEP